MTEIVTEIVLPLTEDQLIDRLRLRYEQVVGNGIVGALIPGVRNDAGFNAIRTIDAIGVSFWPSRGLLLEAYECKSNRADWKKELSDPSKAEEFCKMVDKFWIVAGRSGLVYKNELPPKWGLLVPRGNVLTQVQSAQLLHDDTKSLPAGFDRGFLIALIRQASLVAKIKPYEIEQARDEGFQSGELHAKNMNKTYKDMYDNLHTKVKEFQDAFGVSLGGWSYGSNPTEIASALKAVLSGEKQTYHLEKRIKRVRDDAQKIVETAENQLASYGLSND